MSGRIVFERLASLKSTFWQSLSDKSAQLIAKYKMDDQLDQLLVTREIQDEIKPKIQDNIDELSKNLFNTINQTIKDNFDDIFRQQSENMSNYYEFVD